MGIWKFNEIYDRSCVISKIYFKTISPFKSIYTVTLIKCTQKRNNAGALVVLLLMWSPSARHSLNGCCSPREDGAGAWGCSVHPRSKEWLGNAGTAPLRTSKHCCPLSQWAAGLWSHPQPRSAGTGHPASGFGAGGFLRMLPPHCS